MGKIFIALSVVFIVPSEPVAIRSPRTFFSSMQTLPVLGQTDAIGFDYRDSDFQLFQVTRFENQYNGGPWVLISPPVYSQINGFTTYFVRPQDVVPAGTYTIAFRACNIEGCSPGTAPFGFVWSTPPQPSEWTFCANENEFCSFSDTREVRYGANDVFVSKVFTGGIQCSNAVFGDPIPGVFKRCDTRPTTAPPLPAPVDCVVSDWIFQSATMWGACVNSTQTRTETWVRTIVTQPANGGSACPALTETRVATQSCTAPPPTDVCITDPLRVTRVTWPSNNTGRRSVTFDTGSKSWTTFTFTWPGTLVVTDTRGCVVAVTR